MPEQLGAPFVSYAADILGDTNLGLSGADIGRLSAAYALDLGVTVPHPSYPFRETVPNKRTALYENLLAFPEVHRYRVIRELCEHAKVVQRNPQGVEKLKLTLVARYGHLADERLGSELDKALVERTEHWLAPFPEALKPYQEAVQKHASGVFLRNVLDDLRLALELLLKNMFSNQKSLEKQMANLGAFIKARAGSAELANMYMKLIDYYAKYQNIYVKHDDAVIEEEVEFIFELTSSLMKHLVRLSYKAAV